MTTFPGDSANVLGLTPAPEPEIAPAAAEPSGPRSFSDIVDEARELPDDWEPNRTLDSNYETRAPAEAPDEIISRRRSEWLAEQTAQHQQFRDAYQRLERQHTKDEAVANDVMRRLDAAMSHEDDLDAYDEFERLRHDYPQAKSRAEAEYYKNLAAEPYQRQYEAELPRLVEHFEGEIGKWAGEAVQSVRAVLPPGFSQDAIAAFTHRIDQILRYEAAEGRLLYHTGERLPNSTLPRLEPDFGHVADVVAREVELLRQFSNIERAAKQNAEAEARRRGYGASAPPAIGSRQDFSARDRSDDPADTWQSIMDQAAHID
jgi:hypothetical protein